MNTIRHSAITLATLALSFIPFAATAQNVINGDNNNNTFEQLAGGQSVLGTTFNFLGGNDRLILRRNDDLAGLGNGVANMGDGRDIVLTSFNTSGTFNLGSGNDFFLSEGDILFNPNAMDILVMAGDGNDLIVVLTDFCGYAGEQGDDVFVSDASRNTFDGGAGKDTYSAEAAEVPVGIDLAAGVAIGRFNTGETLVSIESARGSAFNDTLLGDGNPNRLDGLSGNDTIDGRANNDTISGGTGTNTLDGNTGFDVLVVQGTITSKTRLSATTIRVTGTLNGEAFTHIASGFEQVLDNNVIKSIAFFMGEQANNMALATHIPEFPVETAIAGFLNGRPFAGNNNANTISGTASYDDIEGFGGNDTLNGNAGDDHIMGGDGAGTLNGGTENDVLNGGAQNDTVNGGANNDIVEGGLGTDTLSGGAGDDTFLFRTALAGSQDRITDYNVLQDTIEISASLVGNLPTGIIPVIRFKNTTQGAIDADDRIIYNSANGQLLYDSNGSAAGGSVLIATLPTNLNMSYLEIVIR